MHSSSMYVKRAVSSAMDELLLNNNADIQLRLYAVMLAETQGKRVAGIATTTSPRREGIDVYRALLFGMTTRDVDDADGRKPKLLMAANLQGQRILVSTTDLRLAWTLVQPASEGGKAPLTAGFEQLLDAVATNVNCSLILSYAHPFTGDLTSSYWRASVVDASSSDDFPEEKLTMSVDRLSPFRPSGSALSKPDDGELRSMWERVLETHTYISRPIDGGGDDHVPIGGLQDVAGCGLSAASVKQSVIERLFHKQRRELVEMRSAAPEAESKQTKLQEQVEGLQRSLLKQASVADEAAECHRTVVAERDAAVARVAELEAGLERQAVVFGDSLAREEGQKIAVQRACKTRDAHAKRLAETEKALRAARADVTTKAAVVRRLTETVVGLQRETAAARVALQALKRQHGAQRERDADEARRLHDLLQEAQAHSDRLSAKSEEQREAALAAAAASAVATARARAEGRAEGEQAKATEFEAELSSCRERTAAAMREVKQARHALLVREMLSEPADENCSGAADDAARQVGPRQPMLAATPTPAPVAPSDAQLEAQISGVYTALRNLFDVARASTHHQRSADNQLVAVRLLERQLQECRALQSRSDVSES